MIRTSRMVAGLTGWALAVALASPMALAQQKAVPSPPPAVAEVGPDGVQRASVTLDSYSFAPAHLIVQAGKPVELTLTSVTTLVPHNLILKEPAASLSVAQDVGPRETAKVRCHSRQRRGGWKAS